MKKSLAITLSCAILIFFLLFEIFYPTGFFYPYFAQREEPSTYKKHRIPAMIPWLIGWAYRKSHIINSASGAGTDYQVKIVVHYDDGTDYNDNSESPPVGHVYCGGKCRTDFGDIRFTDDDCITILPYYMENKVDGDYAVFSVKILDNLSVNNVTIYIYYGNPSATTTSNGQDTFLQFDSFDTLDTDVWTIDRYNESQIVTVENGQLKFIHNTQAFCHIERSMTLENISILLKLKRIDTYQEFSWDVGLGLYFNEYDYVAIKLAHTDSQPHYIMCQKDVSGSIYNYLSSTHRWNNNTYIWVQISLTSTTVYVRYSYDGINWNLHKELTREATWTTPSLVIIGHGFEISSGTYSNPDWDNAGTLGKLAVAWADDYIVRKFVSPEPLHGAWGAEESFP